MVDMWMDVDAALAEVPVNLLALIDDGDFKTREEAVVFNQAGLDLLWNFTTTAGVFTQTAVVPTDTAGDYDWINQGNAYYTIEIPASGGASINNDAEGFGFFSGFATGVLPWRGPVIGFRAAALNDALIDVGDIIALTADAVQEESLEDHVAEGTVGYSNMLSVYAGPDGPGIYLDSGAANTNTTKGTDGTESNPVSTPAAARTLADGIGLKIYYLEGNSDITLDATYLDWEFIGIGSVADNIVNLGSQDVSRSIFRNLAVEGTQGGSGRISARDCLLQDPGAGTTTLHIFAERCGLVDDVLVDTSADNIFDGCYDAAAGGVTPIITATGAAGSVVIGHYSGKLELKALSASHNIRLDGIGHIIFNADCNVNANVDVHGVWEVTDNTAGIVTLASADGLINIPKINLEMVDVMSVDTVTLPGQEAPPLAPTRDQMMSWPYKVLRNEKDQSASLWQLKADDGVTVDAKATISDAAGVATKEEIVSGP